MMRMKPIPAMPVTMRKKTNPHELPEPETVALGPILSNCAFPGRPAPAQAAWRGVFRKPAFLGLMLLSLCATLPPPPATAAVKHAQKPKPIVEIVAAGKVVNGAAPASGAIVYLKNPISLAIKSYLTGPNGEFHFNNISPQTDYEVWAELNGIQSKHKFISQFSNHTKFLFTLKLEAQKRHKKLGLF